MKILMLTNEMDAGGAETHVLTLACGLCARGHEVVVASSGGRMVERLGRGGVRHVGIPLHSARPDRLMRAYFGLSRLLRREHFDVVHAHARIPALLVSGMARRRGLCFVTTAHADFSTRGYRRRLSRWGYATSAVSEDLRHGLCERYGLDPSRVCVIRNGVDTDYFSPTEQTERSDGFHILCMSRLDHDCAAAARLLCRLAPRLHREISGLTITIVGGGEAYPEISQDAERLRMTHGVSICTTGYVSDPRPRLWACDVFLGVSRAAIEAMACGKRVILGGDEGFFGLLDEKNAPLAARENFCARGYEAMSEDKLLVAIRAAYKMGNDARYQREMALRAYVEQEQSAQKMIAKTEAFYADTRAKLARGGQGVLLCGYYGYGNMGDDALLRAAAARSREKFPFLGVTALTRRGVWDGWQFSLPCVRRSRPLAVMRAIRGAEALVFGGGTLLQDATSRRSLAYYTFLLRYAQRHGVACELWGNGIGALTGRGSERRVARALSGCRTVGLRDERSYHVAKQLIPSERCRISREADLAMGLASSDPTRLAYLWHRFGQPSQKGAVAVAVKGGASEGVLRAMERWLCGLAGEGYTLYFVSMYPYEDDALTDRLCASFGGVRLRGVGAADLVGLFGSCEVVCAMRLHALVFAATAGTPFVGFGTDEKIESFCREYGGVYYVDLYG